jgi:hypothetical protein
MPYCLSATTDCGRLACHHRKTISFAASLQLLAVAQHDEQDSIFKSRLVKQRTTGMAPCLSMMRVRSISLWQCHCNSHAKALLLISAAGACSTSDPSSLHDLQHDIRQLQAIMLPQ